MTQRSILDLDAIMEHDRSPVRIGGETYLVRDVNDIALGTIARLAGAQGDADPVGIMSALADATGIPREVVGSMTPRQVQALAEWIMSGVPRGSTDTGADPTGTAATPEHSPTNGSRSPSLPSP